jgi:hypothetical protein
MEFTMVQAIENRADIEGRVVAIEPDAERPQQSLVTIEVGAVKSVEGYPNMFGKSSGSPLVVILPASLAKSLKPGATVHCRIRRAGPATVIGESCSAR